MNKTVYIRDEDGPLWDRARELAGEKLSPVIVDALRRFVKEKDDEAAVDKGYQRLEVSYDDIDAHGLPRKKAFYGRWIFSPNKPYDLTCADDATYRHALAITAKGSIVGLTWKEDKWTSGHKRFHTFPSFEKAAENHEMNPAVREALEIIGVPIEELNI